MKNSIDTNTYSKTELALSDAGLSPTFETYATDELGHIRNVHIAEERPLTIFLGNQEIVTLMTLGTHPELLALGYLRNQGLTEHLEDIASVKVDWNRERAQVQLIDDGGIATPRTYQVNDPTAPNLISPKTKFRKTDIYKLLNNVSGANKVYRTAGGVHGCALCHNTRILSFIEDIGRHNAADSIAGYMWLNGIAGADKLLYCTGRLTSEIIIKAARMNISLLLSRSGITHLGLELAKDLNITLIARAKGSHFLIYHSTDAVLSDTT
jgi:FdhD protein